MAEWLILSNNYVWASTNTNKYYNVNRHMMYSLLNVKRLVLLQETQKTGQKCYGGK